METIEFEACSKLTEIGKTAFGYCGSLESITIPAFVTTIGNYAFYYNTSLKTFKFEEGSKLDKIGNSVFLGDTSIETVFVPGSVTSIGYNLFSSANPNASLLVEENSYSHKYAVSNKIKFVVRSINTPIASGQCNVNVFWELLEDGTLRLLGNGDMPNYALVGGVSTAPWNKYSINKIFVGRSISKIGDYAFYNTEINTIEFEQGSGLNVIGKASFGYCDNLVSIVLPKSLIELGSYSFYYCLGLKSLSFEDGCKLKTIGNRVFMGDTALETVFVPSTVSSIGYGLLSEANINALLYVAEFSYAHSFAEDAGYNIELRAEYIVKKSGVCSDTVYWELYTDNTLKILGEGAIPDYALSSGHSTAPWEKLHYKKILIGKQITRIGEFAFFKSEASVIEFEAGSTLKTIGKSAFGYSEHFVNITLPATVTTIDNYAFYYCIALKSLDFEAGSKITTIGNSVFRDDYLLERVYFPAGVTSIGYGIFYNANPDVLMQVAEGTYSYNYAINNNIGAEVREEFGVLASGYCSETVFWEFYSDGTLKILGSGDMPDYVLKGGASTAPWSNLAIKSIFVGKGITKVGDFAFFKCGATMIEFESGSVLNKIGKATFGYMPNLISVVLPATVENIGDYAFYYCTSLITFDFEENSSLLVVGKTLFQGNTSLQRVYFPESIVTLGSSLFHNANPGVVMQVAQNSVAHKYALNNGVSFELRLASSNSGGDGFTGNYVIDTEN